MRGISIHKARRRLAPTVRRRLAVRLAFLLLEVDVEGAELISIVAISVTGFMLSLPLETLGEYPVFLHIWTFAPQWAWAVTADALAVWQIAARLRHSRPWCRRGAQVAAGWWMGLATLLFLSRPRGLVWGQCGVFALANCWSYWRTRRDDRRWTMLQPPSASGGPSAPALRRCRSLVEHAAAPVRREELVDRGGRRGLDEDDACE